MEKLNFKIVLISLLIPFSISFSCNKENDMNEKNNLKNKLIEIDSWFKEKKHIYIFDNTEEQALDWNNTIKNWIIQSNYFSKTFIKNISYKDMHFGNFFWDFQDLGGMLKGFCNENHDLIVKELYKESKDKYRYVTRFENVLNSMPDSNADESYMWKYDEGENGEIWQFSIVFVKENDEWKIDKFERYWAKFLEEDR